MLALLTAKAFQKLHKGKDTGLALSDMLLQLQLDAANSVDNNDSSQLGPPKDDWPMAMMTCLTCERSNPFGITMSNRFSQRRLRT